MAGWRRLNGIVVGRKVVVRNLGQHRRARVNYKSQQGKSQDEEIANQKQEEGDSQHPLDDRDFEAWLEEFYNLYKLSKFQHRARDTKKKPANRVADPSLSVGYIIYSSYYADPSLADGYTHLSKTWLNQGGTRSTPPMATINGQSRPIRDHKFEGPSKPLDGPVALSSCYADPSLADGYTHLSKTWLHQGGTSTPPMATINGQSRPIRDNKLEVALSLVAALLFVIGGCLVLSFSSPEVNGALLAPIVCLFTAGYVVLILYDIISRSLTC